MSEQVWITRKDAIKLVKESPWGRLKEPNVVRTVSILDSMTTPFTKERTVYGMSETQKKLLKFEVYLEKTIDQFCETNPQSCRVKEKEREIDEAALRLFLRAAMDEEISDEFGDVPNYKVT